MRLTRALLFLTILTACSRANGPDTSSSEDGATPAALSLFSPDELGTVDLPVSCNGAAAAAMEHGLALLHHMAYTEANLVFESVLEEDPTCSMAPWGSAMTLIHPRWPDVPTEAQLDQGLALVEQAIALGPKTEWEQAYIDALAGYFRDAHERTHSARLISFHRGWQDVHERFPEDWEATAFYVLTSSAVGFSGAAGGALMFELLAAIPDHPAGQHYLIHSYDNSPLAAEALEVARAYGVLAPHVPHALHMPTHIFTKVGLWSESIALNERSVEAAFVQGPLIDGLDNHYPHAMGYLIYAYLQRGQDARARQLMDRASSVVGPFSHLNRMVFAAHLAGMQVRYALERHAWEDAARLELRPAPGFPWDDFTQFDAVTYFGRTIGAARSGDAQSARETLSMLRSALVGPDTPRTASFLIWDGQTIAMTAQAWVEYADGDVERAVTTMRAAQQRSTTVSNLGPGELMPAGELLGDMYLDLGRYDEALTTYETFLRRRPNRFNSLCGAARSAELGGDPGRARGHYQKLTEVADTSSGRECLRTATAFLAAG